MRVHRNLWDQPATGRTRAAETFNKECEKLLRSSSKNRGWKKSSGPTVYRVEGNILIYASLLARHDRLVSVATVAAKPFELDRVYWRAFGEHDVPDTAAFRVNGVATLHLPDHHECEVEDADLTPEDVVEQFWTHAEEGCRAALEMANAPSFADAISPHLRDTPHSNDAEAFVIQLISEGRLTEARRLIAEYRTGQRPLLPYAKMKVDPEWIAGQLRVLFDYADAYAEKLEGETP